MLAQGRRRPRRRGDLPQGDWAIYPNKTERWGLQVARTLHGTAGCWFSPPYVGAKERSLRPIGERYAEIVAEHGFLLED